jgi:hypothetical protein
LSYPVCAIEAEYPVKEQQRNMHQGAGMHLKRKKRLRAKHESIIYIEGGLANRC